MAAAEGGDGKAECRKTPWTAEEDEALRREVRAHGGQNWAAIAAALPGRGAKSCRLRWCQHLAPELDSRPFTPEEDALIVEQHRAHGNKWATIARYLRGRSDNAVKNRWNSALRKMQPQGAAAPAAEEEAVGVADADDGQAATAPACLELFPLTAEGLREAAAAAAAAGRLGVREEEEEVEDGDAASVALTLGLSGLSETELALSLGPVRPTPA
ncbi:hypothetical protein ACP70R_017556 [Stipagrostis hirtigluma subsp. patula]